MLKSLEGLIVNVRVYRINAEKDKSGISTSWTWLREEIEQIGEFPLPKMLLAMQHDAQFRWVANAYLTALGEKGTEKLTLGSSLDNLNGYGKKIMTDGLNWGKPRYMFIPEILKQKKAKRAKK